MPLADRLAEVRFRISQAAGRAGRSPNDVTLVGVSKTVERATIEQAYGLGLTNFGENRVADAEERFLPSPYPPQAAQLHLIGHLQANKAKRAVALFDIIHSVDNYRIAQAISRHCQEADIVMPVLLEINVAGEASKGGLTPTELPAILEQILRLPNLTVRGLMTLAPYYSQPSATRPVFAGLRELFERNHPGLPDWQDLSMGMTNDFEVAIEEGATMVRVGRAIFEEMGLG